jgi:hypothetical protein
MASVVTTEFLEAKRIAVTARAQRLARLTPRRVGLRPQDIPYAPSAEHFQAVNQRLAQISARIARRLEHLQRIWSRRETEPKLIATAMVEREIDRARRSFGMFFEIFSQRGSSFARPLAAHDMIATDCYRAVRAAAPDVFSGALLKPVTYMEPTRRRRNAAASSSIRSQLVAKSGSTSELKVGVPDSRKMKVPTEFFQRILCIELLSK